MKILDEDREQNLGEFDVLAQAISVSDNITDKDLQECYDILEELLQKPVIKVSELTLLASFRYALGRQTYIVSEVVENILANWQILSQKVKDKMKEEIEEAIKNNSIGLEIDKEKWNKIIEASNNECN
jgi:DNA replicative helicase MCM subunit Mcm2 (Cdc46/Mcm family)